jgi:hypothetical protein
MGLVVVFIKCIHDTHQFHRQDLLTNTVHELDPHSQQKRNQVNRLYTKMDFINGKRSNYLDHIDIAYA